MNGGIKLILFVLLAALALIVLKFLIKLSLLVAVVGAVLLLVGLVAKQKMR